jgi:peptidoglycan/xylan/chitin deacetylase (PgdA/CDA1 family)
MRARLVALVAALATLALAGPAQAQLIVSVTFDDGVADQATAVPILAAHGMRATFYVNSARIGHTGYLTLPQVRALQTAGHEIGGHTATHANLPLLDDAARQREICGDRAALLADGFAVRSLAYPFGGQDPAVQQIAAACGYDSARLASGIVSPTSCRGCPVSDTLPPENVYAIRAVDSFEAGTQLGVVEDQIRAAQAAGGWLPLTVHHVCDGCNEYGVTADWFSQLLDFLAAQPDITVLPVGEVVGGPVAPAVPATPLTPTTAGALLQNSGLELAGPNGVPLCFETGGAGDATSAWHAMPGFGGHGNAMQVRITRLPPKSDAKLISKRDAGICAPRAQPGRRYRVSARYRTLQDARLVAYIRDGDGAWTYFGQSDPLRATRSWRRATWRTPPLPAGASAISVGISLRSRGVLTVDDVNVGPA